MTVPIGSVLFAAGRGERLRPLSDQVPKPCFPLLDVPLLAVGLRALLSVAPPVVVNASHLADRVAACVDEVAPGDDRVETVVERPEGFGTAGTLTALAERIGDRVLTCNADLVSDLDPEALLAAHRANGCPITTAVRMVTSGADFALAGDRVAGFVDRRERVDDPGARFIGMAVFESDVLRDLPSQRPAGLGETILRAHAQRGDLAVHVHEGYALDVGTLERYVRATLDLVVGRGPSVFPPGRVVEVAGGHAYLGPGVVAAPGTLGPGAVALRGAVLEAGARVEDAVVWPGETVPAGSTVVGGVWALGRALARGGRVPEP